MSRNLREWRCKEYVNAERVEGGLHSLCWTDTNEHVHVRQHNDESTVEQKNGVWLAE